MYICWLKKKTKQKHWMNVNTIVKPPLTENRDHWGWQYYCQTSVDWKKVIIEGDNIIVKPLLTEKKDHWGWQYYCRTSVDWTMGSLRVIILLSNLCWLKMDHWGWQYYCHICWNKIEIAGSTIRLKMWKVYDILTDGHFSIRKAQLSLWFKWAKKVV